MSTKPRTGPGRPRKPAAESNRKYGVSLPPDLIAFANELGDGKASHGIQIALREAKQRRERSRK